MNVRGTAVRLPNGALFAIGPRPPKGPWVAKNGYSLLVLAANSYQVPPSEFPGVHVINVGVPDNRRIPLTMSQRKAISSAARKAARHLAAGRNALFTCEMGLNRSALVATLALTHLGYTQQQAVGCVRRMRWGGLNNPLFMNVIAVDGARA